jgi:hypothetical protein
MLKNLLKGDKFLINGKINEVVELTGSYLKALGSKGEYNATIHNVNQYRSTAQVKDSIFIIECIKN